MCKPTYLVDRHVIILKNEIVNGFHHALMVYAWIQTYRIHMPIKRQIDEDLVWPLSHQAREETVTHKTDPEQPISVRLRPNSDTVVS